MILLFIIMSIVIIVIIYVLFFGFRGLGLCFCLRSCPPNLQGIPECAVWALWALWALSSFCQRIPRRIPAVP